MVISCRGRLQRVPSSVGVEAAHTTRDVITNTQYNNKKTGRSSRKIILLDMAPPIETICAGSRDPSSSGLLTRQLEDV